MERQSKNKSSQNKRQHDNLNIFDYENYFNPKRLEFPILHYNIKIKTEMKFSKIFD